MGERIGVIGGGAAGIFASLAAANEGARVTLFERNRRIGIKILISGGGKCNVTHQASPDEMEFGFIPSESRFLRYALHELTAADIISLLNDEGVATLVRPNGRVFPESGRAEDVLAAFERALDRAGVEVRTGARVEEILVSDGRACGVRVDGREEPCSAVVVATGGLSYRKVGTTGDGIAWAELLGHTIAPVRPALAPIGLAEPLVSLQGVALRDVELRVDPDPKSLGIRDGKGYVVRWRDDVLFTHWGVSGPAVLEVSRAAALVREHGHPVRLVVDLVPDDPAERLDERWRAWIAASPRSEVGTFVESFVPHAVVPMILAAAGIAPGTKGANLARESRTLLMATLKGWAIGQVDRVPLDRGEVTAGGVSLSEVSSTAMESKLVHGLYVAGEALDVAGSVGGYNLQAAFSTGFVAGRSAARLRPDDPTRGPIR